MISVAGNRDYFKHITKKTLEEATRIPTLDEIVDKQWKRINSGSRELLPLALSLNEGNIYVSQDERENHFWILGSTGEGKSKFLEYLIRKDIDRLFDEQKRGINPT